MDLPVNAPLRLRSGEKHARLNGLYLEGESVVSLARKFCYQQLERACLLFPEGCPNLFSIGENYEICETNQLAGDFAVSGF
jgi:hypothetical protein